MLHTRRSGLSKKNFSNCVVAMCRPPLPPLGSLFFLSFTQNLRSKEENKKTRKKLEMLALRASPISTGGDCCIYLFVTFPNSRKPTTTCAAVHLYEVTTNSLHASLARHYR